MSELWTYEREAWTEGYEVVCGVDEAGAGPLMGPVYAAAVILPRECEIEGLNDSKKLTQKKREALYDIIIDTAVSYGIARIEAAEIDETDILSARMKAMHLAMEALKTPIDMALIDGNRDKGKSFTIIEPHRLLVKGDSKSASIAAASGRHKKAISASCNAALRASGSLRRSSDRVISVNSLRADKRS